MNIDELIELNDRLLKMNMQIVEALHDILFGSDGFELIPHRTYNEQGKVTHTIWFLKINRTDYDFEISDTTWEVLTKMKAGKLSYE